MSRFLKSSVPFQNQLRCILTLGRKAFAEEACRITLTLIAYQNSHPIFHHLRLHTLGGPRQGADQEYFYELPGIENRKGKENETVGVHHCISSHR